VVVDRWPACPWQVAAGGTGGGERAAAFVAVSWLRCFGTTILEIFGAHRLTEGLEATPLVFWGWDQHPVEFGQPPLVCATAASPGPGSSVCAWSSAEYMPLSFLFLGGLVVKEGLVCVPSSPVVQCALWCCNECPSWSPWRSAVVCCYLLFQLIAGSDACCRGQAAPPFSPLASSSTSLRLHMCTRFHYHLSHSLSSRDEATGGEAAGAGRGAKPGGAGGGAKR
jgi:hypothetical protein